MSVLGKIVARKADRLKQAKSSVPLSELKSRLEDVESMRDFRGALRRDGGSIRLIAEIKKASPSRGIIRRDFEPVRIASVYEQAPVSAISVLTEQDFFQGDLSFLSKVRGATSKPILRKDFVFDDYQIYESKVNAADAILLIAAVLERNQAEEYLHLARELGLSVLFEVHREEEIEKALLAGADIVGINNRDLVSLKVDILTTLRLAKDIPRDKVIVSESGIKDRSDVVILEQAGIDAMLIGTSLMEVPDIGQKIKELLGR